MENEEGKLLSLSFKGEDYENVVDGLTYKGFTCLGDDKWKSPYTGCVYKFVLSEGDSYVVRLEEICNGEYKPINTDFCDKKEAERIYNEEHSRTRTSTISAEQIRDNLIERIRKDETFFKCLNRINKLKGTDEGAVFFSYLGKSKLEIGDLLNVYCPQCDSKIFCIITRKREDGFLKTIKSPSGVTYYVVPTERSYKGYIDSVISKKKITSWYGERFVKELEE